MKRIPLIVLAFLALQACAPSATPLMYVPATSASAVFDFSQYAEEGFLITPHRFERPHTPLGIVTVTISPEGRRKQVREAGTYALTPDAAYSSWSWTPLRADSALAQLVNSARALGADGISDLEISERSAELGDISVPTLTASGLAIRRAN